MRNQHVFQNNQSITEFLVSRGVNPSVARQLSDKIDILRRSGRRPPPCAQTLLNAASRSVAGNHPHKMNTPVAGRQGFRVPGSNLMEGEEEEIQMRPSPESRLRRRGFPNPDDVVMPMPEGLMTNGQIQVLVQKAMQEL